jgi:hypothetical protein
MSERPESTESVSIELADLLFELRRRTWTIVRWGPECSPQLIAGTFKWHTCVDVFILRSETDATAYRVPTVDGTGVFNPEAVSYQYHHRPLWTLRAILALPGPEDPGAPYWLELPTYPECGIPEGLEKPVLIRPLSPYPRG